MLARCTVGAPLRAATRPRPLALARLASSSTSPRRPPPSSAGAPRPQPRPPAHARPQDDLKPQPFVLRPRSRTYQLESLSTSPDSPLSDSTLHFVDPANPATKRTLSLPNLFLRDSSIHSDHVHPASQQRLFRTTDIPLDGHLVGYGVHDIPGKGDCLVTEWSTPLASAPPSSKAAKLSVVPLDLLVAILEGDNLAHEKQGHLPPATPWDRAQLERTLIRVPYADFQHSDAALERTLAGLIQDGICIVTGVPTAERDGHDKPELRKLVERIGSLRRTWYGDLWDVKAEDGSLNIAYTNLDLGLHMDLTHFDNPPRYQFLHSLLNRHVVGGTSYFVDTFALAEHLRHHSPSAFDTLATEHVTFEYRNGPHHTRFVRPTLELAHAPAGQGGASGHHAAKVHAVNYSPPFQGPLTLERMTRTGAAGAETVSDDAERLARLHDALGQFAALCDDPEQRWRWTHQLAEGECVVFDNRRVLHARTAFEFVRPPPGEGEHEGGEEAGRWLKGAYMDGDELWSRWRVLKAKQRAERDKARTRGRTLFV
ncbi:uncharacterized protein RHOBADRAFT_53941 [Rhodotorula graminis WP1]|uniref:TauD/TfdA-like domain-containing protein n=1 Tax=Rhodotorula graminis (strain WP1) TaxID=578459 RepID=A0A194S6K0_RHOGW|nr:uncharacterized protein RHOBADRAFT_53941 [Rhodotorula graminis WP1]KPV75041.1 hypothetical protein RHOBADRAFT_53941 [Rhodotorula graminis WP1]